MKKLASFRLTTLLPIAEWLPKYTADLIRWDLIAGITLASFVLPESMAYAGLAGVPPYFGIYCCLAGGLIFALFTTTRQVAVGPTSAISMMVGSTVAVLSGGDPQRWAAIAGLTALAVALIYFVSFAFKLSSLVNFISDSILLGFKAGAAFSIMATQLPKLFGVKGGGTHFFQRLYILFRNLPETNLMVLAFGLGALLLIILGDKLFPGKPITLLVVIASIIVISTTNLAASGIHVAGEIPSGLPALGRPSLRFSDVDGVVALAFACFLMGYIETISAGKTFAMKNQYSIRPQQELVSLGFANLAAAFASGYVVSGGLSQSTVNDKAGARTPMALIICSATMVMILLFLTGQLKNLPEVVLAVIVLHAVAGLIKVKELKRIYDLSKLEFWVAMIALVGVLLFGILRGVLFAVIISMILLIRRMASPNVAVLGRVGKTENYTDVSRHPDNIQVEGVLILRVESSILYFNQEHVQNEINRLIREYNGTLRLLILEMSSSPYVDLAGSGMLYHLVQDLKGKGVRVKLVEALSNVRELLRRQGMEDVIGHISRKESIGETIHQFEAGNIG